MTTDFEGLHYNTETRENTALEHTTRTDTQTNKYKIYNNCNICSIQFKDTWAYNRHLTTSKHIKHTLKINNHTCNCGKTFKHRESLYRHTKTCSQKSERHTSEPLEKYEDVEQESRLNDNDCEHITLRCSEYHCINDSGSNDYGANVYVYHNDNNSENDKNTIVNTVTNHFPPNQLTDEGNIIIQLFKQNNDFKDAIIEQSKIIMKQGLMITEFANSTASAYTNNNVIINNGINNNNSNNIGNTGNIGNNANNTNNTTNTFNLQYFLNTVCKDAINLDEHIDNIQVTLEDLDNIRKLGFVGGISKIIIDSLNSLNIHERPLYCSDNKREIIYYKNKDVWVKDDDRVGCKKIINYIQHKCTSKIKLWSDTYPNSMKSSHKDNTTYHEMIVQITGDNYSNSSENYSKIIKKLIKEIYIDKSINTTLS
jgi:hypothetical protein